MRIVVYACKWMPAIAKDNAGVEHRDLSLDIRNISVECTGSLTVAMLLKPFEEGADGVLVAGCAKGECHFINGNEYVVERVEEAKRLLSSLGYKKEALEFRLMEDTTGAAYEQMIGHFLNLVRRLGTEDIIEETNAEFCLECGVCTGICPISRYDKGFSPRNLVEKALLSLDSEITSSHDIWTCLTCKRCEEVCPAEVDFVGFIRRMRSISLAQGNAAIQTHAGILQEIRLIQARGERKQRLDWLDEGLVDNNNDIAYFVGCTPIFDIVFGYLHINPIESTRSILKLLNMAGIKPAISSHEVCCGHDSYWNGEYAIFKALAEKNLSWIKRGRFKKLIFGCPEGYHIFKEVYPEVFGELDFKVVFWTELFASTEVNLPSFTKDDVIPVTYHDPCRLGRFSSIYESPRKLINLVEGVELREMERKREQSLCCGSSGWVQCTSCNKSVQIDRINEARGIGAEYLITSCPKCTIHLNCALSDLNNKDIKIVDLPSFLLQTTLKEQGSEVEHAR